MRKHLKMRRFIMVRKSESINRKPLGEEVITFTDRKGREKAYNHHRKRFR